MAILRMQVTLRPLNNLPRDRIVNTFYLDTDPGGALTTVDEGALCQDAAALWGGLRPYPATVGDVEVAAYNLGDAKPREPRAIRTAAIANRTNDSGPREVALCLSYFGDRNLPRQRGRMYIGPWIPTQMTERPSETVRGYLQTLAAGISGLGGIDIVWVQRSETTGATRRVTDWWVNDEWDIQRRRGLRETMRLKGEVSG